MRGRTSGFGASICSIVLLILDASAEVHRAHDLLDERNFTVGDTIFRVEVLVPPLFRPLLSGHESINFARCVLGWFVQKNQKASQPTGEVGQYAVSLSLGVKRTNANIGL